LYWAVQGSVMTGLWVIAHECGHQAFSDYKWLNDSVGLVLHSALLVPYHSWRITHGNHHKNTNHLDRDTVFVPSTRSEMREAMLDSPIVNLFEIFVTLTVGWPGYLIGNMTGQKYSSWANHFEPSSPLFRQADKLDVIISDVGIAGVMSILAIATYLYGFANVVCWYGVPYLLVNIYLVSITFLQHTDEKLLHYTAKEWNFVRGALSTIDRDYWWCNAWIHHITDSHVVHHLFSTMPHYNAIEATKYVKVALGKNYLYDNSGFFSSLWKSWRNCRYVLRSDDVAVYRK